MLWFLAPFMIPGGGGKSTTQDGLEGRLSTCSSSAKQGQNWLVN